MNIAHEIFKNTLAYELIGLRINEDGTTTPLHSSLYMDMHPELDTDEYSMEEFNQELEDNIKFMYKFIKAYQKQ